MQAVMYLGVERFGSKGVVVYRAHGGKFKDGWEGCRVPDAASEVEERRNERVRDPRVVYTVVCVDVDGGEGLVWF